MLRTVSVTVVVVSRERFSGAQQSLESIYAHTDVPFDLVYVDGGSPPAIQRYLETASQAHGFTLVRTDYILTPNEARNVGATRVDSKYIVFIDNDVTVSPGWLEALVRCTEETGAWVVGPLYLIGPPGTDVVHMAGGDMWFKEEGDRRIFCERHRHANQRLGEVASQIRREACDSVEFHCMLVRRDAFDRLGPLDEQLMSSREHLDICLLVADAGGTVYFEPASVVTYSPSRPLFPADRGYHLLRWSPEWNRRSVTRFAEKWNAMRDERALRWLRRHRRSAYVYRWFKPLDPVLQPLLTWPARRRRARGLEARAAASSRSP